MKPYKKTLWGSVIAFFFGTSCCWLSSLAIWIGGVTLTGTMVHTIQNIQTLIISLGILLVIITILLYSKTRRNKRA